LLYSLQSQKMLRLQPSLAQILLPSDWNPTRGKERGFKCLSSVQIEIEKCYLFPPPEPRQTIEMRHFYLDLWKEINSTWIWQQIDLRAMLNVKGCHESDLITQTLTRLL